MINTMKRALQNKVTRALRDAGLEDDCGQPTKEGRVLVNRLAAVEAWATRREAIGQSIVDGKKIAKDEDEDGEDN